MSNNRLKLLLAACVLFSSPFASADPAAPATDKIIRGLILQHAGKMLFSPCHERSYAEINDVSAQSQIAQALQNFGLAEQKPLYVEMVGRLDKGVLHAASINFADLQARCQASAHVEEKWRAVGSQPAWSLSVGEQQMKFERDGQAPRLLDLSSLKIMGDLVRLESKDGSAGDWQFTRELCTESDKKHLFGWRATLKSGAQTLRGCAWQTY